MAQHIPATKKNIMSALTRGYDEEAKIPEVHTDLQKSDEELSKKPVGAIWDRDSP